MLCFLCGIRRSHFQPIMAMSNTIRRTSVIGLNRNRATAAGLMRPMTTFVAQRLRNFSIRLTRVCARFSKSLSEGVSASRYQPVESLDVRRRWRGRRRGEDEGEDAGVVDDLATGEMIANMSAGRPVRRNDVVFMLLDVWLSWWQQTVVPLSTWSILRSSIANDARQDVRQFPATEGMEAAAGMKNVATCEDGLV